MRLRQFELLSGKTPLFEVGRTFASFSNTLEALWCPHNTHEVSDTRQMGSTSPAELDTLEDAVSRFTTLSVVMSKLQKGLERIVQPQCIQSLKSFAHVALS